MHATRNTLAILAVLITAGLIEGTAAGQDLVTVSVQDVSTTAGNTSLSELQSRIDALEAQLEQGMVGGYGAHQVHGGHRAGGGGGCCGRVEPDCGCCAPCDSCCCDCCPSKCCRGGAFVDAELPYLRAFNSSGTGFNNAGFAVALTAGQLPVAPGAAITPLDFPVDTDFEITPRLAAGVQLADGFGVRARYWEFDQAAQAGIAIPTGTVALPGLTTVVLSTGLAFHGWDTYVADLEAFDSTDFGGWSITWSAGFRYVEYEESRGFQTTAGAVPFAIELTKDFEGIGLTTGIEFRRAVARNLGAFANLRGSVLVGDEDNILNVAIDGVAFAVTRRQLNDVKFIYEAQAGAESTLPMAGGAYLFGRAGVEVQFWDNFGVSTQTLFGDESTGFAGFFAAAGVAR